MFPWLEKPWKVWLDTFNSGRVPNSIIVSGADGLGKKTFARNMGSLWKTSLQNFADETGLTIHVSHFPPGTSRWNTIEHRFFAFVSKNWRDRPPETVEIIVNLVGPAATPAGLKLKCRQNMSTCENGKDGRDEELQNVNFTAAGWHGEWNYVISPNSQKN